MNVSRRFLAHSNRKFFVRQKKYFEKNNFKMEKFRKIMKIQDFLDFSWIFMIFRNFSIFEIKFSKYFEKNENFSVCLR